MDNKTLLRVSYLLLAVIGLVLLATGIMLQCPLYKLTGLQCPFCGGQRMLFAMLHGEFKAAFFYNPLLFCALPLVLMWLIRVLFPVFAARYPRLIPASLFTDRAYLLYLLILFMWAIVRNIFFC